MGAFNITIVREADPMIMEKAQSEMLERMDPGFWNQQWEEALEPLFRPGLELRTMTDIVEDGEVIASDHVRASRGEQKRPGLPFGYYTVNGFMPTGYATYALERCDKKAFSRLERSRVMDGDILMAGSGKGSVGKVCLINEIQLPSVVGDLYILRLKLELALPEYITAFLMGRYGQSQIFRYETGVSGQTHIDKEEVQRFSVPIPPMNIQKMVAIEFQRMSEHHNLAMDAAAKMLKAQEHDNKAAEEKYRAEYEHNLNTAEAMLSDLVSQVEEIIEGKRAEIEPVERVLAGGDDNA